MTLLKQAVANAVSELHSLELEKPILEHMQQVKARGAGGRAPEEASSAREPRQPLKAVVITRTKLEAAVFGAGYSSLPTMSVEEFYEQRVREGVFPGPGQAPDPPAAAAAVGSADDGKGAEQDRAEDEHEEAAVAKARQWDEYKDDHKRGEGNRYNRS